MTTSRTTSKTALGLVVTTSKTTSRMTPALAMISRMTPTCPLSSPRQVQAE